MTPLSRTLLTSLILGSVPMTTHALSPSPVSKTSDVAPVMTAEIKTKVLDIKSPGGLKVWFVSTPSIPVVTMTLSFQHAGSKNDPEGMAGLTGFLSDMMDEGAGEYPSQGFKKLLRETNVQFDSTNGGDHFYVQFRATKDRINDLFKVMELVLFELRFDASSLDHVRQNISTHLQQGLHSENVAASNAFRRQAFGSHPYGITTQDQLTNLSAITKESMQSFVKNWFTKGNVQITVAGDIEEGDLLSRLDGVLGKLPATSPQNLVRALSLTTPGDITVIDMDIPQSVIVFYQAGVPRNHPDFYPIYVMMKIMADQAFESRLWNEIREKRGLVYGVGADMKWSAHGAYVAGRAATANKNVAEVIGLVREEWTKMRDKGATAAELAFVKEQLTGSYPLGFTSTKQIVGLLDVYQTDGLPANFIAHRNAEIQKVTLEDVNRVSKTFLQPDKLSFLVVGKPEGVRPGEEPPKAEPVVKPGHEAGVPENGASGSGGGIPSGAALK